MIDVVSYLNNGLSTSPNETKKASDEMSKDAFMQLLVAQMSNQNPLEPMENTEFIGQLAQFSALEQQQNIAAGIELLALTQTAATNSQMVNLIGKRVVVPGSEFSLEQDKSVELRFDLKGEASASEIIITDENGVIVRKADLEDLKTGMNKYQFDGKDNDGNSLDSGTYFYALKTKDGELMKDVTQYANYLVDSVKFDGSAILLKSDDFSIDLGDITEVIGN